MAFQFREKHQFEIEGFGKYEFDIDNVEAVAAIQREFPKLMAQVERGNQLLADYKAYCASLGVKDPNATTTGELLNKVVSAGVDDEKREEMYTRLEELNECRDETLAACEGFISGCLGEDVYNEIFGGTKRYMQDHVDLCVALYADTISQRDKSVVEQVKKNRELRRAKGQKNAAKKTS